MRCAVYVRVSTDHEEQKTSLENQKSMFYSLIGEKGWELYQFYIDVESGTTEKRENFQRMLEDAEHGKFDCILAKELSRIARNGELAYKVKRVLQTRNIQLITHDGAINTIEDNTDKFGLYAWLYEEESQRTSRRIQTVFKQLAKRGEFKGSIPPYGYNIENKRLVLRDDETVEVVKLIYHLYLQGHGFESIARKLDSLGYPTPSQVNGRKNAGRFWQGSSVRVILENPHYTGDLVQCRSKTQSVVVKNRVVIPEADWIRVPNTHEAIITRDDFEAVQDMIKSRYVKRPKAKKHLFTNVIFCADCGTSLWYMKNSKGYVCGRYRKHGKRACTSHSVKEEELKQVIINELQTLAKGTIDRKRIENGILNKVRKLKKVNVHKVESMESEIETLKNENKELIKLLARKVITEFDYKNAVEINRNKIVELQDNIVQLKEEMNGFEQGENQRKYKKVIDDILELNDLNEELLHRVVKRIEVTEDKVIHIHFRFANPFSFNGKM